MKMLFSILLEFEIRDRLNRQIKITVKGITCKRFAYVWFTINRAGRIARLALTKSRPINF
jgi:hypothetical protein